MGLVGAAALIAIGTWSLKDLIKHTSSKLNETIEKGAMLGNKVIVELGTQYNLSLENTRNAYEKSLDKTIDELDELAQKNIQMIYSMVQSLEAASAGDMLALVKQVQDIVDSLPLTNSQPRLTSVSPKFVPISKISTLVKVRFKGHFPCWNKKGFEPKLTFHGKACVLNNQTNKELEFLVDPQWVFSPSKAIETARNTSKDNWAVVLPKKVVDDEGDTIEVNGEQSEPFGLARGQLAIGMEVPYYYFLTTRADFEYQVGLTAVPLPGKIIVEYKTTGHSIADSKTTETWSIRGDLYITWPNKFWHEEIQIINPDPGWKINRIKTPQTHVSVTHGELNSSVFVTTDVSETQIEVKAKVYCKGYDYSDSYHGFGAANIFVEYEQYRIFPEGTLYLEQIRLLWGESRVLDPGLNRTINKVRFEPFDGIPQEFGMPDISNPYLKISAQGGGKWKIWTELPNSD